jgi:gluconolactonase
MVGLHTENGGGRVMAAPVDVEVLASGFVLAEAPRVEAAGSVLFSDVLGGGIRRWTDGEGVEVVVPKRRGVGGLAVHADGGFVCGGRDVLHVRPDGTSRTLWSIPEGSGVTGINDLCALPDGAVVFGALHYRPFEGEALVPGEFWHLDERHDCIFLTDVGWPNGCGADPARSAFYACDYAAGAVWCRDADGVRLLGTTPNGEADGLAVDDEGGVWVATAGGGSLVRLSPDDGTVVDELVLGGMVTSLAFDGYVLYVTTADLAGRTAGSLLRLAAPVPGPRHFAATV